MDIFAAYATDDTKEEEGVVVFLTEGQNPKKDPWIRVARFNNANYQALVAKAWTQAQADKKALRLSEDEVTIRGKNSMVEITAKAILKDFGNLEFQGKKLTPSYESNLQLLRVKDFRELVLQHATDVDLYRAEAQEVAAGN